MISEALLERYMVQNNENLKPFSIFGAVVTTSASVQNNENLKPFSIA